jgi:hypothetical protein
MQSTHSSVKALGFNHLHPSSDILDFLGFKGLLTKFNVYRYTEVAAAKSEVARAAARADTARTEAKAANARGAEMQAAFASVLAALDSAVAGAFAPNTAGDKDAAAAVGLCTS